MNFTNIDKNLVTKANKLVEARYKLTATEQKIILMLISKIEPDDIDFKRYRFRVTDFEKLIGVKRKNLYTEMIDITENIMKRVLKLYDGGNNQLFLTHWVQNATYELGTGYAEFTFDPALKPYLLHLKSSFLKYQLKNVVQLKSTYSIRIYELLKQYEKIGERTFDLYDLREILGLKPEEYKLYGDFKRYILKPAERELPKKTDISFYFKEKKKGRKVRFIIFKILSNKNSENEESLKLPFYSEKNLPKSEINNQELYDRLQTYFLLSKKQAEEILKTYDENYIIKNLEVVEMRYKKGNINKSKIGPYTLKALSEDFRIKESAFDLEKEKQEEIAHQKKIAEQERRKLAEEIKKQFNDQKQIIIQSLYRKINAQGKMPEEIQEFEKNEIKDIFYSKWENERFNCSMFKIMFEEFLAKRYLTPEEYDFTIWAKKQGYNIKKDTRGEYILVIN